MRDRASKMSMKVDVQQFPAKKIQIHNLNLQEERTLYVPACIYGLMFSFRSSSSFGSGFRLWRLIQVLLINKTIQV